MKKIILMLSFASFSMFLFAQGGAKEALGDPNKKVEVKQEPAKKADSKKADSKKGPWYNCPQCTYGDIKSGQCPTHKYELVKEGWWHCPMSFDGGMAEAEGRCPKCGMAMIKMDFRNHKEAGSEK